MKIIIIFIVLVFTKTFIGYGQDTSCKYATHKVIETDMFTKNSNLGSITPYQNYNINSPVYYPDYCFYDSCFENSYIENISYAEFRPTLSLFPELTDVNKSRIQIFKWLSLNLQQEPAYKDHMGFYSGGTPW